MKRNTSENMNQVTISVVIPNYNGEKILKQCLDSVLYQSFEDYEIIIVDDASTDDSLSVLNGYKSIRVLINSENSGFAYSVNEGIKVAMGRYVLLLNNDVVLEKNFLAAIYSAMEQGSDIFSVSSRMIRFYERDKLDDTGDLYHILGWAVKRGDGQSVSKYLKTSDIFSTCAGAGLYRKDVLEKIGLFDEAHFAYLEDVDLSWRALIKGYRNVYEPVAICYHIGSATTAGGNKYSDFKIRLSSRNNIYIVYKNMPVGQIILNAPFLLFGFVFKGITFALKGYGKAYWQGIGEGLKTAGRLNKVGYSNKNFKSYLKIEGMLVKNLGVHLKAKLIG